MIIIDFKCEACRGNKGYIALLTDEPFIECANSDCGEVEAIKEFDILGND